MASKVGRYILKCDYKAAFSRATGNPRKPQQVGYFPYKKGDIIVGELKHVNDQPALVMVSRNGYSLPFPMQFISELTEKGAGDTATSSADGGETKSEIKMPIISTNPKVQYADAAILLGLVGVGVVWFAEKKGWIIPPDKKNKIYGALIGVAAGIYLVWRYKNAKKKTKE